jgi:hypothetical protein
VLGGRDEGDGRDKEQPAEAKCPHTALVTHWDEPADLGNREKATYTCEACREVFTYEQARQYLDRPPAVLSSVNQDR